MVDARFVSGLVALVGTGVVRWYAKGWKTTEGVRQAIGSVVLAVILGLGGVFYDKKGWTFFHGREAYVGWIAMVLALVLAALAIIRKLIFVGAPRSGGETAPSKNTGFSRREKYLSTALVLALIAILAAVLRPRGAGSTKAVTGTVIEPQLPPPASKVAALDPLPAPLSAPTAHSAAPTTSAHEATPKHRAPRSTTPKESQSEPQLHMEQHNSGDAHDNYQMYRPNIVVGALPRRIDGSTAAAIRTAMPKNSPRRVYVAYQTWDRNVGQLANDLAAVFDGGGWKTETQQWIGPPCNDVSADIVLLAHKPASEIELGVGTALLRTGLKIFVCQGGYDGADRISLVVMPPVQ